MATTGGWLKGCGIGCGITLLVLVLVFVGCGISVMSPFRSAQQARESLDEAHGAQDEYRPAPDGVIEPDRIEAFLNVREQLAELCGGFDEVADTFDHLDEMDDEVSTTEALKTVFGAMDEILSTPSLMGRFEQTRNEALLEEGMGLGEYSYIYVISYLSWLEKDLVAEGSPLDGSFTSRRQRGVLRGMIRSQHEDLLATDPDHPLVAALEAERQRLADDEERIPWRGGVPEALVAVLEPYRERIEALWCANTASGELSISNTNGLTVSSD